MATAVQLRTELVVMAEEGDIVASVMNSGRVSSTIMDILSVSEAP